MSKFVEEILESIYQDKNAWSKYKTPASVYSSYSTGIKKNEIVVYNYGNSALLSVIRVSINEQEIPTTYMDKYRLEKAVGWWYRNIELSHVSN